MLAIPDTKMLCRDQFCVGTTGPSRPKVPTFGCRADMSPTCRRHCQPSSRRDLLTTIWKHSTIVSMNAHTHFTEGGLWVDRVVGDATTAEHPWLCLLG